MNSHQKTVLIFTAIFFNVNFTNCAHIQKRITRNGSPALDDAFENIKDSEDDIMDAISGIFDSGSSFESSEEVSLNKPSASSTVVTNTVKKRESENNTFTTPFKTNRNVSDKVSNNILPRIPIFPGNMFLSPSIASRLTRSMQKSMNPNFVGNRLPGMFPQPPPFMRGFNGQPVPSLQLGGGRLMAQDLLHRPGMESTLPIIGNSGNEISALRNPPISGRPGFPFGLPPGLGPMGFNGGRGQINSFGTFPSDGINSSSFSMTSSFPTQQSGGISSFMDQPMRQGFGMSGFGGGGTSSLMGAGGMGLSGLSGGASGLSGLSGLPGMSSLSSASGLSSMGGLGMGGFGGMGGMGGLSGFPGMSGLSGFSANPGLGLNPLLAMRGLGGLGLQHPALRATSSLGSSGFGSSLGGFGSGLDLTGGSQSSSFSGLGGGLGSGLGGGLGSGLHGGLGSGLGSGLGGGLGSGLGSGLGGGLGSGLGSGLGGGLGSGLGSGLGGLGGLGGGLGSGLGGGLGSGLSSSLSGQLGSSSQDDVFGLNQSPTGFSSNDSFSLMGRNPLGVNPLLSNFPINNPITGLPQLQQPDLMGLTGQRINPLMLQTNPLLLSALMGRGGNLSPMMQMQNLLNPQMQNGFGSLNSGGNTNSIDSLFQPNRTFDILSGGVFSGSNHHDTKIETQETSSTLPTTTTTTELPEKANFVNETVSQLSDPTKETILDETTVSTFELTTTGSK